MVSDHQLSGHSVSGFWAVDSYTLIVLHSRLCSSLNLLSHSKTCRSDSWQIWLYLIGRMQGIWPSHTAQSRPACLYNIVILLQNLCQSWIIVIPTQLSWNSRYRCTVVWIVSSWQKAKYRNKISWKWSHSESLQELQKKCKSSLPKFLQNQYGQLEKMKCKWDCHINAGEDIFKGDNVQQNLSHT